MFQAQKSRSTVLAFVSALALPACSGPAARQGQSMQSLDQPSRDAIAVAQDARLTALATSDVAGLVDSLGTIQTQPAAGGGCSLDYQLSTGSLALAGDCALPDGRKVSGSVSIGAADACGGAGLHVALDVTLTGAAGSEHVKGTVDVINDGTQLAVSANLDKTATVDGHTIGKQIAACVIVDGSRVGVDGSVHKTIDGVTTRAVELDALQVATCDDLPISGTVDVTREGQHARVAFSSPSDGLAHLEIDHDGQHVSADLDRASRCADPAAPALDFARCGGCGMPAPLPTTDVSGAPADPIP